ncbi:hypothetical protein MKW92_050809 [Papaver armeniacum]|nr:hypothetical protein MKW92_050809 [Papaver armeniacum]
MELQDVTKSNITSSTIDISPPLDEPLKSVMNDDVVQRGLELEPRPIRFVLSFSNLKYSVKTRRNWSLGALFYQKNKLLNDIEVNPVEPESNHSKKKVLLNDISGEAREGEIMAVLGASGSGKSTLIDALANNFENDFTYVMQDDLLFPMLTVEETLMFSLSLDYLVKLSKSKKMERVRALIDRLGLRNAANTVIGDEGHRGISGGERRRVSIGVDIIHDPILLFLDEPTSGLILLSSCRFTNLVAKILSLFDHLIFLSRGQTAYNGSPKNLSMFFSNSFSLDFIRELEVSPGGTKRLVDFNRSSWQDIMYSRDRTLTGVVFRKVHLSKNAISSSISKRFYCSYIYDFNFQNPFWFEIYVLSKRSMINSTRTPKLLLARLATVLVTGFILATIFWQLDNSPKGVQERLGLLVFAISTTFYNCIQALPEFLQERYIFMRETAYNAYRRSSYVLSHSIVTIPNNVKGGRFIGGISGFLFFFIAILVSFWAGSSFVTFLSGVVPDVMILYHRDRIPPYWIWFHYISLVKYPFEGVLLNEFDDSSKCFVRGLFSTDEKLKFLKTLSKSLGMNITSNTCVSTGVDILGKLGLNDTSKWNSIWITLAWGFFFRILFYFCLLFGSKTREHSLDHRV